MRSRRRHDNVGNAVGVVVPVRSFTLGNMRLAPTLDTPERAAFARSMADTVINAIGDLPVVVVSSASEVAAWCRARHLVRIEDPGTLDGAAAAGRRWAAAEGLDEFVVVHADLPRATTLDPVLSEMHPTRVVLVPDRHDDGTPVLGLPVTASFAFAYGPGSFERHLAEARRCGLDVAVVRDRELGFDVDVPDDLAVWQRERP